MSTTLAIALAAFALAALLAAGLIRQARRFDRETRNLRDRLVETARDLDALGRTVKAQAADLETLRQELSQAGGATQQRIDSEVGVVKGLLAQLAKMLEAPRKALPKPAPGAAAGPSAADLELLGRVRRALDDDRIDLFVQPVVSLPQRRVRFFEAFSRIADEDGKILRADTYRPVAEQTGLIATIDNLLLVRCIQLIRKVKERNRAIGFFCNVTVGMLADEGFFEKFRDFLAANQDLARDLIFEFKASDFARRDATIDAHLRQMAELGFAFSLDQIADVALDPVELKRNNIRVVKIDGPYLMSPEAQKRSGILLTDLKTALARAGVELIASKIEDERTVANLQDYDVDYAQGYLFGEPRLAKEYL